MKTFRIIEEGPFGHGGEYGRISFFTKDHEPCEESESDYAYYEELDQFGNLCWHKFLGTEHFDPYKDMIEGMVKKAKEWFGHDLE